MNTRPLIISGFVFWLGLAVGGIYYLNLYATQAGLSAKGPTDWPESSQLQRKAGVYTLVVSLQSDCRCSLATLGNLDRLVSRLGDRLDTIVLVIPSADASETGPIWSGAAAIPNVRAIRDDEGLVSSSFAALTSGQSYLYSPEGKLIVSSGLTPARGHEGDSVGAEAIIRAVTGMDKGSALNIPVFGCHLHAMQKSDSTQGSNYAESL